MMVMSEARLPTETQPQVFAEQVKLTYGQTKRVVFGGVLTGLIFCAMVWDVIDHAYILTWYGIILLLSVLRMLLYLGYVNRRPAYLTLTHWNRAFILLTLAYSTAMGSLSLIFLLTDDLTYHFLTIAWMIGYSSLVASSYMMGYRAALAVFIPMTSLVIVGLALMGTGLHLLAALALLAWGILVFTTMRPINRTMIEAMNLNHQLGLEMERREKLEVQLREWSIRDGLTGLYNRRHFDQVYADESKRANRGGTQLTIVMVDIDCFKPFNDTYGHQAGDDCLRMVSEVIQRSVNRPGDMVARYGGEELVALLPNTHAEQGFQVAERMRVAVLELAIPHRSTTVADTDTLSISAGIATIGPTDPQDGVNLLKQADEALYRAKANGRNQSIVAE